MRWDVEKALIMSNPHQISLENDLLQGIQQLSITSCHADTPEKQQWQKYLQEAQEIDDLRARWQAKIDKGTKAKLIEITFYLTDGFALERYLLPFEQKRMQTDLKEWKQSSFIEKIDTQEIPFTSLDQL